MDIIIKPVSVELIDDFLYFFDKVAFTDNLDWVGCCCYFYHFDGSDEEWEKQTGISNRLAAIKLIQEERMRGYLAYLGENPIGWCNVNDKSNYPRIVLNKELRDEAEQKICSIVCFIIAPEYRKMGVASQILQRICSDYTKEGYECVEAYPRKGELTSAQHYHGPLSMYMKAGFVLHKEFGNYDIVRKKL